MIDKTALSHDERRDRRQRMASMVRRGKRVSTVARSFRVSLATVKNACREFDVKWN
ncbi:MAG TPA: hypothetical protein VHC22_32715 [Pirellulales bacterium]|nr:hypothetical protein [Pirellulales bacterium]